MTRVVIIVLVLMALVIVVGGIPRTKSMFLSRALMILGLDLEKTNTKSEETGGGRPKVLRW